MFAFSQFLLMLFYNAEIFRGQPIKSTCRGEKEIEMAAPGMESKDFKVEVKNRVLCISS